MINLMGKKILTILDRIILCLTGPGPIDGLDHKSSSLPTELRCSIAFSPTLQIYTVLGMDVAPQKCEKSALCRCDCVLCILSFNKCK